MPSYTRGSQEKADTISVSQAVSLAKAALKNVRVRIIGEVSEAPKPGYKMAHFTLKDRDATLPCKMWGETYIKNGVKLQVGMSVEISGYFDVYPKTGSMEFYVFSLELAGEGYLRMEVEKLKQKLAAEGLLSDARKRPLPAYPETIGLVTSPQGAAVRDVLRTLRRRYPLAQIHLAGVKVEGEGAPEGLAQALEATAASGAEVILLVRGGGSYESLMPFNDEGLARAIAACPVPVVTGIGHEPDTTIADLVADKRASTPTAAAEVVAPDIDALRMTINHFGSKLTEAQQRQIDNLQLRVERIEARSFFADPQSIFLEAAQTIDTLTLRLSTALPKSLAADRHACDMLAIRLRANIRNATKQPQNEVERLTGIFEQKLRHTLDRPKTVISSCATQLKSQGKRLLSPFKESIAKQAARLEDLSPVAVIARGYAIARTDKGAVIGSISQVRPQERVSIQVRDGTIACTVQETIGKN